MTQDKPVIIEGKITFEDVYTSFTGAVITVRVEDVSYANARSRVVAEQVIQPVALSTSDPRPVPFRLASPPLDERSAYELAVHVDVDGTGSITPGDYITMQSYPVPPSQAHVQVDVRVRPVR